LYVVYYNYNYPNLVAIKVTSKFYYNFIVIVFFKRDNKFSLRQLIHLIILYIKMPKMG